MSEASCGLHLVIEEDHNMLCQLFASSVVTLCAADELAPMLVIDNVVQCNQTHSKKMAMHKTALMWSNAEVSTCLTLQSTAASETMYEMKFSPSCHAVGWTHLLHRVICCPFMML